LGQSSAAVGGGPSWLDGRTISCIAEHHDYAEWLRLLKQVALDVTTAEFDRVTTWVARIRRT
jgi:hypothetical protein